MPLDAVQTNYNKATRELQQMADLLRHGTADKGAVALGNIQGIRVQLFILPYQNQYFVLSSCDIIGSNNLCAVF